MSVITVSVKFKNTGQGQADVSLTGPGIDTTYHIDGDDSRDFDLPNGIFSISVDGTSGTDGVLNVTGGGGVLVDDTGSSPHIVINDNFDVDDN